VVSLAMRAAGVELPVGLARGRGPLLPPIGDVVPSRHRGANCIAHQLFSKSQLPKMMGLTPLARTHRCWCIIGPGDLFSRYPQTDQARPSTWRSTPILILVRASMEWPASGGFGFAGIRHAVRRQIFKRHCHSRRARLRAQPTYRQSRPPNHRGRRGAAAHSPYLQERAPQARPAEFPDHLENDATGSVSPSTRHWWQKRLD
jgi:hypothetical protein